MPAALRLTFDCTDAVTPAAVTALATVAVLRAWVVSLAIAVVPEIAE